MKTTFPHLANYRVAIEFLLERLFGKDAILTPPPISKNTLALGIRHSPDFVCAPFKYNLGNFIEALENGADVLIQGGGGCRYGYYGELQEQILKDLGYDFKFVYLFDNDMSLKKMHAVCRELGCRLGFVKFVYNLFLTMKIINAMDKFEFYMRENIGFEAEKNSFENLQKEFFSALKEIKGLRGLNAVKRKYFKRLYSLPRNMPESLIKVGIVGELYTLMEPHANCFIEKELAKFGISVSRFTNASYLLFQPKNLKRDEAKSSGGYIKYALGADGTKSVAVTKRLAENGYDGIIHIKPFGCMPEVNAMPVLQNISRDFKIPVMYLSFDSQTSETGIKTRLEAFVDMLKMRVSSVAATSKENSKEKHSAIKLEELN